MGGRGLKHSTLERQMILSLLKEATSNGARLKPACEILNISVRTVERWRKQKGRDDQRRGPSTQPRNKLTPEETQCIINELNSPKYRDLSPNQIVPLLADKGCYLASESSFYRILRREGLQNHREPSKVPVNKRPKEKIATGPGQVWSWDITYLRSNITGQFFYLYMVIDVWSRKIVGWKVNFTEDMELSSQLIEQICIENNISPKQLKLHSDNGSPMKGATMLATLEKLGVASSFSRPKVSNDNPYSESIFRTLKYRPEYPKRPFKSIEEASIWVCGFVNWYNNEHLHSAISFVTPSDRHAGIDIKLLKKRDKVYKLAKKQNPHRWSGKTRNWTQTKTVVLNGNYKKAKDKAA